MGSFSPSLQVQNKNNLNKEEFIQKFIKTMEEKGYKRTDNKDSKFIYALIFSPNINWITISHNMYRLDEYNSQHLAETDASLLSKNFNTKSICMIDVDNDFDIAELYDEKGNKIDEITCGGDPEGYMGVMVGKEEYWKPLLINSTSFDEFCDIAQNSFLEDFAKTIGIAEDNILLDWEDFSEENENTTMLYFET